MGLAFPGFRPLFHPNDQRPVVGDPGYADFTLGYSRPLLRSGEAGRLARFLSPSQDDRMAG